jgi:predicted nuclease of predicted toxin-antitoxin system
MRILLDENLPRKLAAHLSGHECRTVVQCEWPGKQIGELLALADPLFDILLNLDKDLPYQQNLDAKLHMNPTRHFTRYDPTIDAASF